MIFRFESILLHGPGEVLFIRSSWIHSLLIGFQIMNRIHGLRIALLCVMSVGGIVGCGQARTYALNTDLAQASVVEAMQAWVDGAKPEDLKPNIIVGDTDWGQGRKLASFELLEDDATTDGSNLHIRVKRKFRGERGASESTVKYIVSTSPAITIFPQQ